MYKLLVILYVLSIFIVPSSILLRPEYVISFIFAAVSIFAYRKTCVSAYSYELKLLLLLSFFAVISVFFQNLLGAEIIYRDLMILVRYAYYVFAIIAGGFLASKVKDFTFLKLTLFGLVLISGLISVFQYYNLFSINTMMHAYFGEKNEALAVGQHWRRVIGTYGNPNYWGLFLDFCTIISLYHIIFKKSYMWFIPAMLLMLGIVYTGSRTALVALVLSTLVVLFLVSKYKVEKFSKNILFAVMLFVIVSSAIKFVFIDNDTEVYSGGGRFSVDNITTLEMRIEHWRRMINHTFNHPLQIFIGGGESKGRIITFGDNMYLKYFRDYGLLGVSLYLLLLIRIYRSTLKIVVTNKNIRNFSIPYLWMFTCFLIFDLAADSWFIVRIAGIVLFYYGFLMVLNNKSLTKVGGNGESVNSHFKLERWRTKLRRSS